MKTIFIATSKFGNPISDYYKVLGKVFSENKVNIVFIFDGTPSSLPKPSNYIKYYSWPSKRPTKIKDFIFILSLLKKYRPILSISNFGSTNVMTLASLLTRVPNRVNYVHTTTTQINLDSKRKLSNHFFRIRKKYIYKLNTHLITNSEGTKDDTSLNFKIPKKRITVFPLLIKSSRLNYLANKEREEQIVIVGRLDTSKGHFALIEQFSKCLKKFPRLKLKIIGDGPLQDELYKLVSDLDMQDRVIFAGRIPNIDIDKEFSRSLISISSSVDEAFGLVNIEALREGTPIVCTKTAGTKDILVSQKNGMFYNVNEVMSLSNAIDEVLSNWSKYSNNSLRIFDEKYCIEKVINTHCDMITSLFLNEF